VRDNDSKNPVIKSALWSRSIGPTQLTQKNTLLHAPGNDTADAQLLVAKLVSLTDSEGLWVEALDDARGKLKVRSKMLIPWTYIQTVRSDPVSGIDREKIGFSVEP
jgi:hypothetical protein